MPGLLLSLHTWGRTLVLHPHIHCLITAGGWADEGPWKESRTGYLLPVQVVKALFRGKFLASLRRALDQGTLQRPAGVSIAQTQTLLNQLGRKTWNVRIQGRYEHGQGVLTYLARYVRGGPLSNRRLVQADERQVTFRYTDHRDGQTKPMAFSPDQFLQRILLHVPEPGSHRVRYCGLYASAHRARLLQCRQHLGQPPIEPVVYLDWQSYWQQRGHAERGQCPVCGRRLVATQAFPPGGIPPPVEKSYAPVV